MSVALHPKAPVQAPRSWLMPGLPGPLLLLPLARLFPTGVAIAQTTGDGEEGWLYDEELASLSQAGKRRRREFALGRSCARHVLLQLGHTPSAIPVNPDRSPRWPAGIVGSISHCHGHAAAVAARRGAMMALGLDLEQVDGIDLALAPDLCTRTEQAWLRSLPLERRQGGLALLFCAKEAFYKCQYPLTRRWLEFGEVSLGADPQRVWVESAPGGLDRLPWSGRHAEAGGCMLAGFSLPRPARN